MSSWLESFKGFNECVNTIKTYSLYVFCVLSAIIVVAYDNLDLKLTNWCLDFYFIKFEEKNAAWFTRTMSLIKADFPIYMNLKVLFHN